MQMSLSIVWHIFIRGSFAVSLQYVKFFKHAHPRYIFIFKSFYSKGKAPVILSMAEVRSAMHKAQYYAKTMIRKTLCPRNLPNGPAHAKRASTDKVNKGELICWWFVAGGGFSLQSPYLYLLPPQALSSFPSDNGNGQDIRVYGNSCRLICRMGSISASSPSPSGSYCCGT